jgi:hypothetical protein
MLRYLKEKVTTTIFNPEPMFVLFTKGKKKLQSAML